MPGYYHLSLHPTLLLSLLYGLVGDDRGVEHLLSQLVQHLPPVVVEASLDLVDSLLLDHPQLTLRLPGNRVSI